MKYKNYIISCLLLIAVHCAGQANVEKLQEKLRLAPSAADSNALLNQLASAHYSLGREADFKMGLKYSELALALATRTGNQRLIARSILMKSTAYALTDQAREKEMLNEGLRIARTVKDTVTEASAYWRLGMNCMKSDPKTAKQQFDAAFALYASLNNFNGMANCMHNLCYLYNLEGDYNKAITCEMTALKWIEKSNNDLLRANILYGLGYTNYYLKNSDLALHYYLEANKVFRKNKNEVFILSTLVAIGEIYEERKDFPKAIAIHEEALKRYRSGSDIAGLSGCLYSLGSIFIETKNYPKAQRCLEETLTLTSQFDDKRLKTNILGALASLYTEQKNYPKAITMLTASIQMASEINSKYSLVSGYRQLADLHSRLGRYDQAYAYQKLSGTINDSLLTVEKLKFTTEMQAKYEADKRTGQIELLNKDNSLMQARIDKKNTMILFLLIGAMLVILVTVLLFNRRHLIQQNVNIKKISEQKQLTAEVVLKAQEVERRQIAQDVHDGVGAYLSSLKLNMETLRLHVKEAGIATCLSMEQTLDVVITQLQTLARNFASDTLFEHGIYTAIEELVELINHSKKIKVEFLYSPGSWRLEPELETNLFRITQELLNNSMKHSGASSIHCNLSEDSRFVNLQFSDNGKGFNFEEVLMENSGIGLQSVEARTKIMNGSFHLESKEGKGTSFFIKIPKT